MFDPSLMISALRRGQNGSEILSILDALTDNSVESVMQTVVTVGDTITTNLQPTLKTIEF